MITKILGAAVLGLCLAIVYIFEVGSGINGWGRIFHWPAILLTGIGPFGIALLSTEWMRILDCFRHIAKISPQELEKQNHFQAHLIQQTTNQMYRQGTKALERHLNAKISFTLRRVLKRMLAKVPMRDIADLVSREQERTEAELNRSIRIVGLGLKMAPSVGMLGTILGMVQLLAHLKSPENIGSHMSLALLTTFYGLFFSLVVWTPMLNRLESILDLRMAEFEHIQHWLEILEERKPIQYFEDAIGQLPPQQSTADEGVKATVAGSKRNLLGSPKALSTRAEQV